MSECRQCGRELPSHHLGCAAASLSLGSRKEDVPIEDVPLVEPDEESAFEAEQPVCAAEGCQDAPKPYGGRGPRPKFCAAHSGKGK